MQWTLGEAQDTALLDATGTLKPGATMIVAKRVEDFSFLALCEWKDGRVNLEGIFPFGLRGAAIPFRFRVVTDDDDLTETVLSGSYRESQLALSFYDVSYAKYRRSYRPGEVYEMNLSMLAYELRPGVDQVTVLTNQETLREMHGPGVRPGADGLYPTIDIHTEGCSLLFCDPDRTGNAEFMGTIVEASSFTMKDLRLYRIVIEIVTDETESIRFPLYVSEERLPSGWIPTPGEWVQGIGWLHGYRTGAFDIPVPPFGE